VVLSGPTAVGKTTVLRRIKERGLPYHVGITATTRPRRADEVDGRDYLFYTRERFEQLLAEGGFIEHAQVHRAHLYGIPVLPLREALAAGKDVILPPEPQGAATVRARVPGVVTIFLAAPSFADLEQRIHVRGGADSEEIARRLATARAEMQRIHEFDYLIINEAGKVDETVDTLHAIIQAEKHRVHRAPIVV
jgi:guanylate kinase